MKCTNSLRVVIDNANSTGPPLTYGTLACERLAGHDGHHVAGGLGCDCQVQWANDGRLASAAMPTLYVKALPVQLDSDQFPVAVAGHCGVLTSGCTGLATRDGRHICTCTCAHCTVVIGMVHCGNISTHCYVGCDAGTVASSGCACLCGGCMPNVGGTR